MNGVFAGETPYTYSDRAITSSSQVVEVRKEGYHPATGIIKRNEELNVGALVGGLFFWPAFLWIMDYKSQYTLELEPVQAKIATAQ